MLLPSAMTDQIEIQEMGTANPKLRDAFKIEEILRRAYQIHREHGGIFGYDFEDWAQAWSGLPETGSQTNLQPAEAGPELTPEDETEVFEPCLGLAN